MKVFAKYISDRRWTGSGQTFPSGATLVCGMKTWAKGDQNPAQEKHLSLRESELRVLLEILPEMTFSDLSIGHRKLLITEHFLITLPMTLVPSKASGVLPHP